MTRLSPSTTPCRPPARGRTLMRALATGLALTAAATSAQAWELSVCADPDAMPQSNRDGEGYENKIIEAIADELGAELRYTWWMVSPSMIKDQLREGNCDLLIGMADGVESVVGTLAYYRSPYAFVYRAGEGYDIQSFDDEILSDLKIATTTEGNSTHLALTRRGHTTNLTTSSANTGTASQARYTNLIDDVATGAIDVAVTWGPVAGYFAAQYDGKLIAQPAPEFDFPMIPLYHSIIMATRLGDESLRDLIDTAIAARWEEIYEILAAYHIPTLDMPRPRISVEGQ